MNFTNLLSPIRIGPMEVRNRLVMSAYQTNLAANYMPTPQLLEFHRARARGGVGLIILEGVRCHPTGRGTPSNLIGWDETAIPAFRQIADAIHAEGAKVIAQLLHQGRAANSMETLLPLWSASAVRVPPVWALQASETTHAMTKAEIDEVIQWWARCAVNMQRAGMDGVEIHAGHGYLPQQFLSPLTNFRHDEYGGSLRNRARFLLELVDAVRRAVGRTVAVGTRFSADELVPGGLTVQETSQVAGWLEDGHSVDYLNVTHSTTEPKSHAQQIPDMSWPEASFVHLAAAIKKSTRRIPVFTVGRIVDPVVADRIIAEGKADLVCMARAHIADPEIGRKLREGRYEDIRQCIGCNQGCAGRVNAGLGVGCLINPEAGRELELGTLLPADSPMSVLVIGGGPAGMEAARVAALRGHRVALYEKVDTLGGQINTLVKAPHRREFGRIVGWLEGQLRKLEVSVRLGVEAGVEEVRSKSADAVIVATGSRPNPQIDGSGSVAEVQIVSPVDVLEGRASGAKTVVLVDEDGHHKAASTAEFLADSGAQVHFVTSSYPIASEITSVSRVPAVARLIQRGVRLHPSSTIGSAGPRKIVIRRLDISSEEVVENVDLLVGVTPNEPLMSLFDELQAGGAPARLIAAGDCIAPRRAIDAIREGHVAGRMI